MKYLVSVVVKRELNSDYEATKGAAIQKFAIHMHIQEVLGPQVSSTEGDHTDDDLPKTRRSRQPGAGMECQAAGTGTP